MKQIVLFDYGDVIAKSRQNPAEAMLCSHLNIDRNLLRSLLSETSEQGNLFRKDAISEPEFWSIVLKKSGNLGVDIPSPQELSKLWMQTYSNDSQMLALLDDIRGQSRTGILSNIDRGRSRELTKDASLMSRVDLFFPSYHFGYTKYDRELWESVDNHLEETGQKGDTTRVIYIDDRPAHVASAEQIKWQGILFEGVGSLKTSFAGLGLIT